MTCRNYALLSEDQRILQAYTEMVKGGVDRFKAASLIAVSQNETDYIWAYPRKDDARPLYFGPLGCGNCRQIVGWEYLLRNGSQVLRHISTKQAVKDRMVQEGVIYPDGRPGPGLFNKTLKHSLVAFWFELVLAHRDVDSLVNFSIGPTQMFLMFHWSSTFATNWNRLWQFYTSDDASRIGEMIKYLPAPFPASDPGNEQLALNWLKSQTGQAQMPNGNSIMYNYYHGIGFRSYKAGLDKVIAVTGLRSAAELAT